MKTAALILAAGESRRMGFPKPLLEFQGNTFLDHLSGLLASYCSPVMAVLGAQTQRVRGQIRHPERLTIVENQRYLLGQLSSMQAGLRAMPPAIDGVLFTLVDHPNVRASTIEALLEAAGTDLEVRPTIPRFNGRRGHPIYIPASLIPDLLALPPDASAKDLIRTNATFLDVNDPGIIDDIDDPALYRNLVEAAR